MSRRKNDVKSSMILIIIIIHKYFVNYLSIIAELKQCFNCQKYDHIDKICRYKNRYFVCFESHNNFTCKMSMNKRKCVNYEDNYSI
jgi:hypothetical protein